MNKKKKKIKKKISIFFYPEIFNSIKNEAELRGISMSAVLSIIITNHIAVNGSKINLLNLLEKNKHKSQINGSN